ncbi:MAG: hypothetical protein GY782_01710 [Gammaproteobacteria bacterium]|nr:hypothetical protein [Gammaproteobacteria bacterium]
MYIGDNPKRGIQPSDIKSGTPYFGLQDMPRKSIALCSWKSPDNIESTKYIFHRGEILFGKLRPYFHKVGVAPVDGICSTDILVVSPKIKEWFSLLIGHLSSVKFIDFATSTSTGTRMPRTSWKNMGDYRIVLPPTFLAKILTEEFDQYIEKIFINIEQFRELSILRDTLLPKLLSGEIRVAEAEKLLEEVV